MTMDTFEIIRQLEADPALKAQLRAVLLGDDVLKLPSLVAENSKQIAELGKRIDALAIQTAENSKQIAELGKRIDALAIQTAENSKQIAELGKRIDALAIQTAENTKEIRILKSDMGHPKGELFELKALYQFDRLIAERELARVQILTIDEIRRLLDDCAKSAPLDNLQRTRLLKTDVIASARRGLQQLIKLATILISNEPS
jgi:chromosome segregation ATPase